MVSLQTELQLRLQLEEGPLNYTVAGRGEVPGARFSVEGGVP